jgi:hypothetical protein
MNTKENEMEHLNEVKKWLKIEWKLNFGDKGKELKLK